MSQPAKQDSGGRAFPSSVSGFDRSVTSIECVDGEGHDLAGMTLLDYFAAHAMQAMISNRDVYNAISQVNGNDPDKFKRQVAYTCYEQAAEMLAEKARREGGAT